MPDYTNEYLTSTMGMVFVQPGGPGHPVYPLPCTDFSDATIPQPDVAQQWVADPVRSGHWLLSTRTYGAPERPSASMSLNYGKAMNWLESMIARGCDMPVYVRFGQCEPKNIFNAFDRLNVWAWAHFSAQNEGAMVSGRLEGVADAPVVQTFPFTADYVGQAVPVRLSRQTTVATDILRDIAAAGRMMCAGGCGPGGVPCEELFAVGDRTGATKAKVLRSLNGGVSWAATATEPFAASEDIAGVEVVWLDGTTRRVIVSRATTDAGNPAEIAYSDDDGATWVAVNVNTTNGVFFEGSQSLFALDRYHIWAGLTNGAIYFSADAGLTWTQQDTNANADDIWYIHMASERVGLAVGGTSGASTVMLYTTDGGEHWSAPADPDPAGATVRANCCVCFDAHNWLVGYENGEIWQTENGGVSWRELTPGRGAGQTVAGDVWDMRAIDRFCVWITTEYTATADARATVQRTLNGGADWEVFSTPVLDAAGAGLQAVLPCGYNEAFVVGDVETTTYIAHLGA